MKGEREDKKEKEVDENKSENEEMLDDVKLQEKNIEKETKVEELREEIFKSHSLAPYPHRLRK